VAVKLKHLHKGYWIYQSPRVLLIIAYLLSEDREMISEVLLKHLNFVKDRLKLTDRVYNLEELKWLGYEPKRDWAKDLKEIVRKEYYNEYLRKLNIITTERDFKALREVIKESLQIKNFKNFALLPPSLLYIEKVYLLSRILKSKYFCLEEVLKVIADSWVNNQNPLDFLSGEKSWRRKEFRFRYVYLNNLDLTRGEWRKPKLTSIGMAVMLGLQQKNPMKFYERYMIDSGKYRLSLTVDICLNNIFSLEKAVNFIKCSLKYLRQIFKVEIPAKEDPIIKDILANFTIRSSDVSQEKAVLSPKIGIMELLKIIRG